MRKLLVLLAALLPTASWANYGYFANNPLTSANDSAPVWYLNGATANSSSGLTVTTDAGGSYIFKNAAPDGTNQYEVAATLHLPASGGSYVLYLEATPNAVLGSTSTGSFYAFAIQNPSFANGGCTATATLYKVINGSVSQMGATAVPCSDGVIYHAVLGSDAKLRFWVNNVEYLNWSDSAPLSGTGGVGGYRMPSGNSISLVQIGPCDRVAPSPVDAASVQTYPLANRLDLRAAGSADDANGVGVDGYTWFRDGAAVATTQTPVWSDVGVTGGASHSYGVQAYDHHGNVSAVTNFTVAIPAAATLDARQVGVRPTGSYWGGMGEQIDTRSGNLNFSVPLIQAMSRGWSVPVGLTYNSQNWRLDAAGTPWQLGADVGFGFGWQLQIGSLTPFYSDYFTVQFYQYSDAGGATYRLDQNNNGLWTAKESVYVTYDANAQRLYFDNGSFWVLGCTSAGTEGDAGTMYPTLMQDSNGNRITVRYAAGKGVTWLDSSARLLSIQDVRPATNPTSAPTFSFSYNNDATPHLTGIANAINSQDSFAFTYTAPAALASPFGGTGSFDQASFLRSTTNNATNLTTDFTYDAANNGELDRVTFPLGGYLRWQYGNAAYAQTTVREVVNRYVLWDAAIGERSYVFSATPGSGNFFPAGRQVVDSQAGAAKQWQFGQTQDAAYGLMTSYAEGASGQNALRSTAYTWAQDTAGNPYLARLQGTTDPGQSYAVTKQVDQSVDAYGNVTETKLYDYADLAHPAKTYRTTYLTNANGTDYTAMYIRNRVASVTVTDRNNVTTTLKQNTYDQYPNSIAATSTIQQHDTQDYGPGYFARGNVYDQSVPGRSWHSNYDQTGTPLWTGNDINPNLYVSQSTSAATNYTAPDLVTTANSLNTHFGWTSSLHMNSKTGANQESTAVQYDTSDRPQTVSSPYGANTVYQYSVNAPQITATTNARFVKTSLDGLGRVAKIERGDNVGTTSVTETVYDACGCNPIGKVYRKSMPHAPGAAAVWTQSTYDSLGRALSVTQPDGHSATTYAYAGNTVTITDPSGKWKKMTRDAFGELARVDEPSPRPTVEPNHVTLYTYDVFGHLTQARMDRTVNGQLRTQTRTWNYDSQTLRLLSKTSPEAGTYNADNTLATVTDAKAQRKVYSYDNYGRVIQIAHGTVGNGTFSEDATQRVTYTYDGTNGGYSSATNGRVSQIAYAGPHGVRYVEQYSYQNAGGVVKKRVELSGSVFGSQAIDMDAGYTYDNEGRVTSIAYPFAQVNSDQTTAAGPVYHYTYDAMGRLNHMNDDAANITWVDNVTYGPADEMLQMQAYGFTETHVYNANLQLTELASGATVHYRYNYAATGNNGQIQSQTDVVSGETISYQYDSLQRLVQASGQGDPSGAWSQAYTYDGFGNLTQKTGSNAPALSVAVDPATNRLATNAAYDNNGNMTGYAGDVYSYDLQNRMIQAHPASGGTVLYGYDTTNHRVYKGSVNGGAYTAEEIYFYGVDGHKYGTWQINPSSGVLLKASVTKQLFGSRPVSPEDRLGSQGKYYPYGEERTNVNPPNPPNDQEKFATYTRDSATGLDYANQRYYDNLIGRFTKPDPFGGSAHLANPQSWNRYAYVNDDPTNGFDPNGLDSITETGPASLNSGAGAVFDPTPQVANVYGTTTGPIDSAVYDLAAFNASAIGGSDIAGSGGPFLPISPLQGDCNLPPTPSKFVPADQVQLEVDNTRLFILGTHVIPTANSAMMGEAELAGFLLAQFKPGGDWDLKHNFDRLTDPINYERAKNLGNFAFGAVAQSLGLNYYATQNVAGIVQIFIRSTGGDGGEGFPIFQYPYGDQQADAQFIQKGHRYEILRQSGECPE